VVLNIHAQTGDKTDDVKDSFYEELEYFMDIPPVFRIFEYAA
jgi:hypothetical protein